METRLLRAIASLPREQVSAWREIHEPGEGDALELDWRTLPRWTPEHREAIAAALHDWVLEQDDACDVMRAIVSSEKHVGVWLACVCARTVLQHVVDGEDRPRLAIETTERWVRGFASGSECYACAKEANKVTQLRADRVYPYAARSSVAAAYSAYDGGHAPDAATYAAFAYTSASKPSSPLYTSIDDPDWVRARKLALRGLCQAIALAARDAVDAASHGYSMELARGELVLL